jgi:DNA polymerase-3 subunit beta
MTAHKPQAPALEMAATIERQALLAAVETAGRIVGRGNTIPILAHLRIELAGGHCAVTGSNMDQQITARCQAQVFRPLQACADAALLQAAVKAADGEISLALEDGRLVLRSADSTARLATLPVDEFPASTHADGEAVGLVTFEGDSLQAALVRLRPFISREGTRYYLNGVWLELGPKALLTATDGHKLRHVVIEAASSSSPRTITGILPRPAVEAAIALGEPVTLELRGRSAILTAGDVEITTRLIDGQYPDWRQVVPEAQPGDAGGPLARQELIAAVERVAWAAAGDKARPVKLAWGEARLELSVHGEGGGAEAETVLDLAGIGRPGEVGFNARFLVQALQSGEAERVRLQGAGAAAPWQILDEAKPDDRTVLMPLRV